MPAYEPQRVVIGVQDSIAGVNALRRGVAEARRRHATVYAVRASTSRRASGYLAGRTRRVEQTTRAAQSALDVFVRAVGGIPPDVEVRVIAVDEPAGPALVSFADREDDLLVVGDAQRRGMHRLRSGSVARHCVRRAGCPVLVVPPPVLAKMNGQDLVRAAQRLTDA
jgi:nucleotide-binding universal stress UspA family protein